jgi:hypothetical protein
MKGSMASEAFVIRDREKADKLIPVLTYVHGLSRPKAISAWLSFLSICHEDCRASVRLPGILAAADEAQCLRLLDSVIESYLKVDGLPLPTQSALHQTAHKIIAGITAQYRALLKDRLFRLCGGNGYHPYWDAFENGACLSRIAAFMDGSLTALQLKKFTDFAGVIIALTVLYGCGDEFHGRVAALEENVRIKFESGFPFDRLGLFLWPLEFSFAADEEDVPEKCSEHRALLSAAAAINPDVKVQVCAESLVWSRDALAWLSDDYDVFVESAHDGIEGAFGRGLLSEGGNIIAGAGVDKFILVAQGSLSDMMSQVDFHYQMDKRQIRTYPLPDGFLWSRDPVTKRDCILDSIHIDTVINVIPASCTVDGKLKIIIDPYYHAAIAKNADFMRFLKQQAVLEADVIDVDESELYLNLPNFSVLPDRSGNRKFLFNRDKGRTLPRLRLKAGLVVQPEIEITRMASAFGSIRCATNMLPESYVTDTSALTLSVAEALPPPTKARLGDMLATVEPIARRLSRLFVSQCCVRLGRGDVPWDYDEIGRAHV